MYFYFYFHLFFISSFFLLLELYPLSSSEVTTPLVTSTRIVHSSWTLVSSLFALWGLDLVPFIIDT